MMKQERMCDRIEEIRRARGMSQEELGDRLNVSRQTVSRWETGESEPGSDMLRRLCDLLAVDPVYLLYGNELTPSFIDTAKRTPWSSASTQESAETAAPEAPASTQEPAETAIAEAPDEPEAPEAEALSRRDTRRGVHALRLIVSSIALAFAGTVVITIFICLCCLLIDSGEGFREFVQVNLFLHPYASMIWMAVVSGILVLFVVGFIVYLVVKAANGDRRKKR